MFSHWTKDNARSAILMSVRSRGEMKTFHMFQDHRNPWHPEVFTTHRSWPFLRHRAMQSAECFGHAPCPFRLKVASESQIHLNESENMLHNPITCRRNILLQSLSLVIKLWMLHPFHSSLNLDKF